MYTFNGHVNTDALVTSHSQVPTPLVSNFTPHLSRNNGALLMSVTFLRPSSSPSLARGKRELTRIALLLAHIKHYAAESRPL